MFLNPNNFFQFQFQLFYISRYEKPPETSLKSILLAKIVLNLSLFQVF